MAAPMSAFGDSADMANLSVHGPTKGEERMKSLACATSAAWLCVTLLATPLSLAQDLQPGNPIRMIVGLSPGGGTDVTARLVAQKMSANMGMTVLVENKAGGNFIPAARELATSAPDGHTLYF